jgi:hypothetical protein
MLNDPNDPIAEDVRLTTSELVTNVIRHTGNGGELRAWDPRPDVPLRVEVQDSEPQLPSIPTKTPPIASRSSTRLPTTGSWSLSRTGRSSGPSSTATDVTSPQTPRERCVARTSEGSAEALCSGVI